MRCFPVADPTQITITQTIPAKIVVNPAPVTIYGGSTTAATNTTIGGVIVGTGLTVQANGLLSANGTANLPFANLTGLPATLALHGITDGLTAANLTGYLLFSTANATYSVLGHTHTIANVTGLQTALDGKLPLTNFTYANLTGTPNLNVYLTTANATIANITGLQTTLDGKQATGSYVLTSNSALTDARTPLTHTQAFSTITSTPTTLGGYGITDGLPSANFTYGNITGKPTLANVATSGSYNDLTSTPNLTLYLTTSNASSTYAPIASPSLTGTPAAPTATAGTNTTQVATTAFVTGGIAVFSSTAASTYAPISTTATLAGTQTLTNKTLGATAVNGTMSFSGNITSQLQLQAWRETFTSPAIASGTLTLDLSASNFFKVSLSAAISTITTTNTPANVAASFSLEFTADGTARAITWPAAFKWTGGTAPVPTSTSGKTDTFIFYSTDTGTTWRAYVAGQNQ